MMNTPELCDCVAGTVSTLKSQIAELVAQFDALDAARRAVASTPIVGRPTETAREALRSYLFDELGGVLDVAPVHREVYYVEGRRVAIGPAQGPLAARALGPLATIETQIERLKARANRAAEGKLA